MLNQRIKILVSMVLSLIIVEGYVFFRDNPAIVPVTAENVKGALSRIKFPNLTKVFTLNFSSDNAILGKKWGENSFGLPEITNPPGSSLSPTPFEFVPTPTTDVGTFPTVPFGETSPTPTTPPRATSTPKPTKTPTPAPISIGEQRPGTSLAEMAKVAEKATCAPAALILAVRANETGAFFKDTPDNIKKYNTFGWWKNGGSCPGMGYNTISGIVPPDAGDAGTQCQAPIGNQSAAVQQIMGIMQMSIQEQTAYTDDYQRKFKVGEVDRRIPFDAMVLAGFHFKNISLERSACNLDWDLKYIAKTACKYQGVCTNDYGNGNTVDYCQKVCESYVSFGGGKVNCAGAANTLKPGTCDFK